jgi:acyl dehydratase
MATVPPAPPRLGPLYLKAALGAVRRRGRALPAVELARADVRVDRGHLAEYARVCGFPVADSLPATYPHVLGFPLHVALMADRAFPLPLPGLVHVRNTIAAHRRLDAAEPFAVRVHAERLVAHRRGAQVDIVTLVETAGERVWEGRSTYLARGASAPADPEPASPEPSGVPDGPPGAVWRVGADAGRRYAAVSRDVNPIHLHPLVARAFGFPRAIAHGMWTAAHALAALQGRLPDALTYDVVFGRPVLLPSTVQLRTRAIHGGWDLEVGSPNGRHLAGALREQG